jgi:hypothetical protein
MKRTLHKNHRKTKRNHKKHLGFLGILKRYLDVLAG